MLLPAESMALSSDTTSPPGLCCVGHRERATGHIATFLPSIREPRLPHRSGAYPPDLQSSINSADLGERQASRGGRGVDDSVHHCTGEHRQNAAAESRLWSNDQMGAAPARAGARWNAFVPQRVRHLGDRSFIIAGPLTDQMAMTPTGKI